jgi:hypothetical protein
VPSAPLAPEDVLWRLNLDELNIRMRNNLLIEHIENKISREAGVVMSMLLIAGRFEQQEQLKVSRDTAEGYMHQWGVTHKEKQGVSRCYMQVYPQALLCII